MTAKDAQLAILIAYAITVPLVVVPGVGGAMDMLAPLAMILAIRNFSLRVITPLALLYAFLSAALISSAITFSGAKLPHGESPWTILLVVRMVWIYLPLVIVLQIDKLEHGDIYRIYRSFLWSGGLACLIGIALWLLGIEMREEQQRNYFGDGLASAARAGGILGNSGDFGHLASVLATVSVTFSLLYRRFDLLARFALGLALVSIYAASSRAAIIHIAIVSIIVIPVLISPRWFWWFSSVLALFFAAAIFTAPKYLDDPRIYFVLRRFDIFNLTGETLFFNSSGRVSNWSRYIEGILDRPLLGYGYKMIIPEFKTAGDNSFLTMFVETGIVSGVLYLTLWISILYVVVVKSRGAARWVNLAIVLSEITHMLTVDTHGMWATSPVALLFVGLSINIAYLSRVGAPHIIGKEYGRSTRNKSSRVRHLAPNGEREFRNPI